MQGSACDSQTVPFPSMAEVVQQLEEGGKRGPGHAASPHLPHSMTRCFDVRVMFRRKEGGVLVVSLCLLEPRRAVIEISFQTA